MSLGLGLGLRAALDAGPRDLHELLLELKPSGWRESLGPGDGLIGLWRPRDGGRAEFIRPSGTQRVRVYGNGLDYDGSVGGVTEYLRSQGVFG